MKRIFTFITFSVLLIMLFSSLVSGQTMWTKYPGNPVLEAGDPGEWDQNFIYTPSVLFKDNVYHMWYGVYLATPNLTEGLSAVSQTES